VRILTRHRIPVPIHVKARRHEPQSLQSIVESALRLQRDGKLSDAEEIYRKILAIEPDHADSLHLLGMIRFAQGCPEAAAESIRKAIAMHPRAASYQSNLGNVLQSQGKLDEAADCYKAAIALRPRLTEPHMNLGNIHLSQDRLDDAEACYRRAIGLQPDSAEAYSKLAGVLRVTGEHERALEAFNTALSFEPNHPQARLGKALVQLLQGNFAEGWGSYERRWGAVGHDKPMREYSQPRWNGETLASGQLLLWGEQGVGDEVMFAGLLPEVVRRGNRCILDCDPRLKPLFARSFPDVKVVCADELEADPAMEFVAHLPAGSLPRLLGTTNAKDAAPSSPYLIADPFDRRRIRERYADGRLVVGIAWHTANRLTGRTRSLDLSLLAPLLRQPHIKWVSLQYGDHDALKNAVSDTPILFDPDVDQLSNIDLFAAQVAAMDLVITIDNSTAHLAGALGVPVWVLLPFAPDWRWLLQRKDSPWYPSMRLFRQPKMGDWQAVVDEVRKELSAGWGQGASAGG
jgi:Tfp pilus assembly protein PilF